MTIAKGQKIVYNDLVEQVTTKIKSVCQNIDSFRGIPAQMTYGYENVKRSYSGGGGFSESVNDSIMQTPVPLSTVTNQLTKFLQDRGIDVKLEKEVTARDMFNFYQNVASFMSAKVVQGASIHTNTFVMLYDR